MNDKPIYKIIDCRGRITIPKVLREEAEIETGDVVELYDDNGIIHIKKAEVIHINAANQVSLKNTAMATFKEMDEKSLFDISKKVVGLLEKRRKGKK